MNNKWTKEKCSEESTKYNTKMDFQKGSNGAYLSAYRHGWLDDICSHMIECKKKNGFWNYDSCKDDAVKYNSLVEYQKKSGSSYNVALKNGWLDDICSHMKRPISHNFIWSKEKCREESLKYNTRTDFKNKSNGAYSSASKNGWLDEICSHMLILGNKYKRCIYVFEFSDNFAYIGLTYNANIRKWNHLRKDNSQVYRHKLKTGITPIFKKLTDYLERDIAVEKEKYYVDLYREDGWNIIKTGSLGSTTIIWNYEKCKEEALKYNSKVDLIRNSSGSYQSMKLNKWLDELCSHMKRPIVYNFIWSKEKCREESLKYKTRSDFKKHSGSAYSSASKNGWLDEICSHMK